MNPGDQHVNRFLRAHVRRASKLRLFRHALNLDYSRGIRPMNWKPDMGEYTMKPLLVDWMVTWMNDPRLAQWITSSWRIVTSQVSPPLTSFRPPQIFLFCITQKIKKKFYFQKNCFKRLCFKTATYLGLSLSLLRWNWATVLMTPSTGRVRMRIWSSGMVMNSRT